MNYHVDDVSRSFYRILDVRENASLDEIRAAHRRLAFRLHPDKQSGSTPHERDLAERRMREVNEAWTVLSDPDERASYDDALRAAELRAAAAIAAGQDGGASQPSTGQRAARRDWSPPDNFDGSDPAFARAFHRSDANGDGFRTADGQRVDAVAYDADSTDDVDPVEHRRRNRIGVLVVLAVLVVAGAFLVVTAYAGDSDDTSGATAGDAGCVSMTGRDREVIEVACEEPNDGRIVARVDQALECPEATTYAAIEGQLVCVAAADLASDPATDTTTVEMDVSAGSTEQPGD